MGGAIHDTYDPSWVDLWGSPPPGRYDIEVSSNSSHLPDPLGLGTVPREYTAALLFDPCAYCGQRPECTRGGRRKNELDHIEPRSAGGVDTADNRIGACKACNREKRAQPLLAFLLDLR